MGIRTDDDGYRPAILSRVNVAVPVYPAAGRADCKRAERATILPEASPARINFTGELLRSRVRPRGNVRVDTVIPES